jgi:hypothetical protein
MDCNEVARGFHCVRCGGALRTGTVRAPDMGRRRWNSSRHGRIWTDSSAKAAREKRKRIFRTGHGDQHTVTRLEETKALCLSGGHISSSRPSLDGGPNLSFSISQWAGFHDLESSLSISQHFQTPYSRSLDFQP